MKKLIALLIAAVLVLAGCSGTSDEPLTVWAMGAEGEALTEMTTKYTEETGVEVEVLAIPWDQAHDKLVTAVAGGEGPDVVQLGTTWVAEFAEAGALADLSEYSADNPNLDPTLYFEGSQSTMYYNDVMVSVPWYVDTRVLYYRTDYLAEAGYDHAPATWEEMLEVSEALVSQGITKYSIDLDINDQILLTQYAWQNGWEYLDEEGNVNFDDPAYIEAMEYIQTFVEEGYTVMNHGLDITQSFADGTFAMFVSGPWMISVLNENAPQIAGQWSIAPLPAGSSGSISSMGGSNLAIWNTSDQKEEAAAFINWMLEPTNQIEWFGITSTLPSQVAAWEDPALASSEYAAVFEEALATAKAVPMIPEYEVIAQEAVKAQERIMVGLEDPATVAADLQATAEGILNEE